MKYKQMFKCRACGKEYGTGFDGTIDLQHVSVTMSRICTGNNTGFFMFDGHRCEDGKIGVADFIGFEEVKD